ncbi:MAG: hypothetical protein LBL33_06170 [Tannerella sp.]|nr:hypothetical protein [Tannerella sp.]
MMTWGDVMTWWRRGVACYALLRYNLSVTTSPWYDVSKGVARYAPTQYTIHNEQYTTHIVRHRLSGKKNAGIPGKVRMTSGEVGGKPCAGDCRRALQTVYVFLTISPLHIQKLIYTFDAIF